MAFILTRLQVGDYDAWKAMFDTDGPGARRAATRHRVFRSVEDPNEVFIQIEYPSVEEANTARDLLVASGVLDRFEDKNGPTVCEVADDITH